MTADVELSGLPRRGVRLCDRGCEMIPLKAATLAAGPLERLVGQRPMHERLRGEQRWRVKKRNGDATKCGLRAPTTEWVRSPKQQRLNCRYRAR